MKVKLSLNNKFDGFSSNMRASGSGTQCRNNELTHYKKSVHLINEDKNKVSITRPAESVSFGGSASSNAAKAASNLVNSKEKLDITDRLAQSKTFHKLAYFSDDNEAKVKALLALGLAGFLKPMCVLAMPGAEEEDKQFTATKNALSAFIGYLLSCAVLDPISSGVNKFLDNPGKYIKDKNNWLLKTFEEDAKKPFNILTPEQIKAGKAKAAKEGVPYYFTDMKGGMKTVYKNGLGIIVAPLKAALTIALMPFILKLIFGDSKGKKKAEKQDQPTPQMDILNNSALTKINMNPNNMDKVFDSFIKGGMQK